MNDLRPTTLEEDQAIAEDNAKVNRFEELCGEFKRSIESRYINLSDWYCNEHGVYKEVTRTDSKGGSTSYITASPIPIVPTALYRNKDTDTEKVKLEFIKNCRIRNRIVDRRTIAGKTKILDLCNYGIEVSDENARELVKYFFEIINANNLPYGTSSNVLGWYTDNEEDETQKCFIPYIGNIQFDGEEQYGTLYKGIKSKGTVEEWADFIRPLRKDITVRLGLAASFASPLLELIGAPSFIFHIWGGTEVGKTALLTAAMSIWGYPNLQDDIGLVRSLNMTANSMLTTAAFFRNLPFAGDELQTIKSEFGNYDTLVMRLTEGINRGRMSYDKMSETKTWKCSFIFSGEEPIIKDNSGGGAVNRVIECYCAKPLFTNARSVYNTCNRKFYGTAGKKYIEKLIELDRNDSLSDFYESYIETLLNGTDTTDKQASAMAILLTADSIASELFWNGEEPLQLEDVKHFLKSQAEVDVSERAYETIMSIISINAENFKQGAKERWGMMEEDGTVYMIAKAMNEQLTENGYDFNAVKKKWADKGYIERGNEQGKLRYSFHKNIPGNGQPTVVKFTPRKIAPVLEETDEPIPEELN